MISDAQRIDPSMVKRWFVTGGGMLTVVLATCPEEARALGEFWFTKARPKMFSMDRIKAREASDEDVDRWLALRRQDDSGKKAAAR